jgi:ATP-dependent phosphoenolpyruvate carboxykinase
VSREWTKCDVYFLEGVGVAEFRGDSDLSSVIEVVDSLVHEVLTREEIEESVGRLVSANLIEVDASNVFTLTSKAKFLVKESPTRNSVERIRWMQPALKMKVEFDDDVAPWSLDDSVYAEALAKR